MNFRKLKFKNKITELGGYSFASKGEANLYNYLYLRFLEGDISDLQVQCNVYLTDARILYIADFSAIDSKTKERVYYEFKGFETAVWRIKRRLWKHYGPGVLYVYKGRGENVFLFEELIPTEKPPL